MFVRSSIGCGFHFTSAERHYRDDDSRCSLLLSRSTWKFMVFVHAKIAELKVKDLSQKLQGITGFLFYLQLYDGQQLKHQILLKSHTE